MGAQAAHDHRNGPWWLHPARLFDGQRWRRNIALRIDRDCITDIATPSAAPEDEPVLTSRYTLSPGFFDVQVNGGGGVLFNNAPQPATLATIGAAHARSGTTAWLPTLITDTPDTLDRSVDAVIATLGKHGVVGMHIEGPHINVGRKGTHSARLIRPFDDRTLGSLCRLRENGVPTLLTLAPELAPAGMIARLRSMGIVVSAGHTAATAADIERALKQGLSCFTHLHNAMTPMTSREPGVVGAALDSNAYVGIIVDGHHVSDTMVRISLRARPNRDRCFVVSDAMATVGGPDAFVLYGETIRVDAGRLINANGSLAGAHIDMARSVLRLVNTIGVGTSTALAMATRIPAEMMGLTDGTGSIRSGGKANLVLLKTDCSVAGVIQDGEITQAVAPLLQINQRPVARMRSSHRRQS